jgi:hypothetical protein
VEQAAVGVVPADLTGAHTATHRQPSGSIVMPRAVGGVGEKEEGA